MTQRIHQHLYVLLIITLSYITLLFAGELPLWVTLTSLGFAAWRLLVVFNKAKAPNMWVLAPITIMVALGIVITYKGLIYRNSGVSLLLLMMMLKLLEVKTPRDYTLLTILGFLLTGASFLFSQSIATFILATIATFLLTTALVQSNQKLQTRFSKQSLYTAGTMLLQAIPLMLILFLLFPRVSQPLWGGSVSPSNIGTTGMSDAIELNQISQLVKNGGVAFRVKFKGKTPQQDQLYWRGPVLWYTDGKRWEVASKYTAMRNESLVTSGTPVDYTMTMEPNQHKWLVLLDMPNSAPKDAQLTHDRTVLAKTATSKRIRYNAQSWPNYQLSANKLSKRARRFALQTAATNPKTTALGKTWAQLAPEAAVQAALSLFETDGFVYTLNPPKTGAHPIDDFLFTHKRGFCEHYATSFVSLMRAAGVPARVVTGYQGGEANGDYLIVRQSNAHAWAEVWLQNRGWVRVDPTRMVAPERVEQDLTTAIQNSANRSDTQQQANPQTAQKESAQLPLQERMKAYPWLYNTLLQWDSIENGWNQWVIDYNEKKQKQLIKTVTGQSLASNTIAILCIIGIFITSIIMAMLLAKRNKQQANPAQQLYAAFIKKLKPFDLTPHAYETATDFANRAANILPHHNHELLAIANLYNQLSYSPYRDIPDNTLIDALAKQVNAFDPKRATANH